MASLDETITTCEGCGSPRTRLFQETLASGPFWMLVACILVNRTKWAVALPVFQKLRRKYPDTYHLCRVPDGTLRAVLRPLGLQDRRSKSIRDLAKSWQQFMEDPDADGLLTLPGLGQYALDSYRIFVLREKDVRPGDKKLKEYVRHLSCGGDHLNRGRSGQLGEVNPRQVAG